MSTNEEILTAMLAGESVDNLEPVGVNGKILKAKAQGESVAGFEPVGSFGKLLKDMSGGGSSLSIEDFVYSFYDIDKSVYPYVAIIDDAGYPILAFTENKITNNTSFRVGKGVWLSGTIAFSLTSPTSYLFSAMREMPKAITSGNVGLSSNPVACMSNYGNTVNATTFFNMSNLLEI